MSSYHRPVPGFDKWCPRCNQTFHGTGRTQLQAVHDAYAQLKKHKCKPIVINWKDDADG